MNLRLATIVFLGVLLLRDPALTSDKQDTECDTGNWNVLSTLHFDLYYQPGMEDVALKAAELAESGYILVADFLAYETTSIIRLKLYPPGHGLSGFLRNDRCDPRGFRRKSAIDVTFHGSYADLRRSITHELTHSVINSIASETPWRVPGITINRIPFWLNEGMARYFSSGFDGTAEALLRNMILNGHFSGLKDLPDTRGTPNAEIAAAGQAFCSFINKRFGTSIFGELVRDFLDIGFPDAALHAVTGITGEELDREWVLFLMEHYQRGPMAQDSRTTTLRTFAHGDILIPAVSPDGGRIAALHERNKRSDLVLYAITRERKLTARPLKTLLPGSCGLLKPVAARDNRISWSKDGRTIVLAGLSKGRPCLLVLDAVTGRAVVTIKLPFNEIKDPSLSPDGSSILFTGVTGSAENIYLYDRSGGKIARITDDDFSDRYPVMSPDGSCIVFSSNWNPTGDPARAEYHIDQINIRTGKRTRLSGGKGSNIQPEFSTDGKRLLFVSERNGTRGVYIYNFSTGDTARLTDAPSGSSNPRWLSSETFIATRYDRQGFDIFAGSVGRAAAPGQDRPEENQAPRYREPYADPVTYAFHEYNPDVDSAWIQLGSAGTMNNSYLCYFQAGLTDYLRRHTLILDANYVREPGKNFVNAGLAYNLRIQQVILGIGIFRQSNPLYVHSLDQITGLEPDHSFGIDPMEHYGGYLFSRICMGSFFSLSLAVSSGKYESTRRVTGVSHDMRMAFGAATVMAECDTLKKGFMVPVSGFRGYIMAEHAFDFTANRNYTRIGIDLRQHISISRQFTCSLRGAGAALVGPNRGGLQYYAGGFNSLRGYGLNTLSGRNMFLFNAELGFTPVDWRTFGAPFQGGLGSIGAVLFYDLGSAWNGGFRMIDKKTGLLADLKMDFGVGIRMAISPLLILKLDFAWPFDNKSIKQTEMLFSIGIDY